MFEVGFLHIFRTNTSESHRNLSELLLNIFNFFNVSPLVIVSETAWNSTVQW